MKTYFVISDTHSFYKETILALEEKGFDPTNDEHIIIHCGDLCDRGPDSWDMVEWAYNLYKLNRFIFVRGNHEDLFEHMIIRNQWTSIDKDNGTLKTLAQLQYTKYATESKAQRLFYEYIYKYNKHWDELRASAVNFYETNHYIFVHGWIPCLIDNSYLDEKNHICYTHKTMPNWREASEKDWYNARWENGMALADEGCLADKTIVCGHFHTSWGHINKMLKDGCAAILKNHEFDFATKALFQPYYSDGIIAIDACTAGTHMVNVLKFTEEEI